MFRPLMDRGQGLSVTRIHQTQCCISKSNHGLINVKYFCKKLEIKVMEAKYTQYVPKYIPNIYSVYTQYILWCVYVAPHTYTNKDLIYMQPHHHPINHTPVYFNGLF